MTTTRHFSAGGLVFRRVESGIRVVLISRQGGTVWCLPKGHIHPPETTEQAALREVREEAGLTARILGTLGEVSYWFVPEGHKKKVFKKLVFFLMRYNSGSTKNHDFEVDEARWFSVGEAVKKISYPSERKLVEQVILAKARIKNRIPPFGGMTR